MREREKEKERERERERERETSMPLNNPPKLPFIFFSAVEGNSGFFSYAIHLKYTQKRPVML